MCFEIMLYNIRLLYLYCVFHGIRFKVSKIDWVAGKQPLSFLTGHILSFFLCQFIQLVL